MHTFQTLILNVFILCSISTLFSQNFKRKIIYTTQSQTQYSVPRGTDLTLITNYDFAGMKSVIQRERAVTVINNNLEIIVERTYHNPMRYPNDFQNIVSRAVISPLETILYDANNVVLQREPNPSSYISRISHRELNTYGLFNHLFTTSPTTLISTFGKMGYSTKYFSKEQRLELFQDSIAMVIDYKNLKFITRTFSKGIVLREDQQCFQKIRDAIIPHYDINIIYRTLQNGTPLKVSKVTEYQQYSILDRNNRFVVDYQTTLPPPRSSDEITIGEYDDTTPTQIDFSLYPNPSQDQINIEFDGWEIQDVEVEVINLVGAIVYTQRHNAQTALVINISDWNSGIYLVRCKNDIAIRTMRFVKN